MPDVALLKQLEDRQENILKKLQQLQLEVAKLTGAPACSVNQVGSRIKRKHVTVMGNWTVLYFMFDKNITS